MSLIWTKEKPTKPGWYFYRLFDGKKYLSPSVYHIVEINQYIVVDTGDRRWPISVESDMCRWAGPIEEPHESH